jgi:hypothetical protein
MNVEDLKGKWSVSDNVNDLDWRVRSPVVTSKLTFDICLTVHH